MSSSWKLFFFIFSPQSITFTNFAFKVRYQYNLQIESYTLVYIRMYLSYIICINVIVIPSIKYRLMTKKRAGINSNVYELYNFQTSRLEFFDGVSK